MNKNNYLIDLSESRHTDFGRVDIADQSDPQKVFSAIWALESQVNNGGFLQYFISSDGDTADFAPAALRSIGAQACASVVERALRAASLSPLPDSQDARKALADFLSDAAREQPTWFTHSLSPQWYWGPISDYMIHRIHERVLNHIKHTVESS